MSSFRNINQFLKELSYNNDTSLRKYSIQVSNVTLDKLLTGLADEVPLPDDDHILKAVYIVGKNTNSKGQSIWALNEDVFLDENGKMIKPLDFGYEWLGNLSEGDGINIAKVDHSCIVHTPLSSEAFDVMCHFLAGTLSNQCANNVLFGEKVNQTLGPGLEFPLDGDTGDDSQRSSVPVDRSNFLSQFVLASQAVVFANFPEVRFSI
jgi:hypothetical protein